MDYQEKFIDVVRQFPILYDKGVHDHKWSESSRKAWQRVAFIVGLDVRTCKKKWKSLRTTYAEALHQRNQFPNKKIEWKYFERLTFLKELNNPKILEAKNEVSEQPDTKFEFEEVEQSYLSGSEASLPEQNGLNGTGGHIRPHKSIATDDSALDINDSLDLRAAKKFSVIEQKYNPSIHEKFYEDILKEIKREDDFDPTDLYFKNLSQIVKGQPLSSFDLLDLQSKLSKFLQDELAKYSCHQ